MPTISILTPFRNSADYIGETADSIFNQSFVDWEWILINDHTEQHEVELLQTYLTDSRVKLLSNAGKGIRDALVTGFDITEGTFVTRMDADDIMPLFKLEKFVNSLNESDADIVTGKVSYFSSDGEISEGYRKYENWLNTQVQHQDFYSEIYHECTLSSGNWMMRKDRLKTVGGFNDLVYPEDYDLLFRWYEHGLKIKGIDDVTHLWREHPLRTSRNSEDYGQKSFFELKINRFIQHDHLNLPLVLNGTGAKGRLTAKILVEKNIPFQWVSVEPEKFRSGVYGEKIVGYDEIKHQSPIQILNATSIENEKVQELYNEMNDVRRVIML